MTKMKNDVAASTCSRTEKASAQTYVRTFAAGSNWTWSCLGQSAHANTQHPFFIRGKQQAPCCPVAITACGRSTSTVIKGLASIGAGVVSNDPHSTVEVLDFAKLQANIFHVACTHCIQILNHLVSTGTSLNQHTAPRYACTCKQSVVQHSISPTRLPSGMLRTRWNAWQTMQPCFPTDKRHVPRLTDARLRLGVSENYALATRCGGLCWWRC